MGVDLTFNEYAYCPSILIGMFLLWRKEMSIQQLFANLSEKVIEAAMEGGLKEKGSIDEMANLLNSLGEFNASVTPTHTVGDNSIVVTGDNNVIGGTRDFPAGPGNRVGGGSSDFCPIDNKSMEHSLRIEGWQSMNGSNESVPDGWKLGTVTNLKALGRNAPDEAKSGDPIYIWGKYDNPPDGWRKLYSKDGWMTAVPDDGGGGINADTPIFDSSSYDNDDDEISIDSDDDDSDSDDDDGDDSGNNDDGDGSGSDDDGSGSGGYKGSWGSRSNEDAATSPPTSWGNPNQT